MTFHIIITKSMLIFIITRHALWEIYSTQSSNKFIIEMDNLVTKKIIAYYRFYQIIFCCPSSFSCCD